MKKATVIARFHSSIETVWNIVTDNTTFDWRSDIVKIEVSHEGNRFTELTKDGFETEFTIVLKKPYERYEFDMKNKNMDRHWIGLFQRTALVQKSNLLKKLKSLIPL